MENYFLYQTSYIDFFTKKVRVSQTEGKNVWPRAG